MTKIRPIAGLPLVIALIQLGCADLGTNDDQATTIWNGALEPEPNFPDLSGQAGALSRVSGTETTIRLEGAQSGTTFTWALRLGTCDSPGQQIGPDGDYPQLVTDASGEATENATLGPTLSLESDYHVDARTDDASSARVVCGDLVGEASP